MATGHRSSSSSESRGILRNKWMLPALGAVLLIATIWIAINLFSVFAPAAASRAKPPSGGEWDKANALAEQLHTDNRFRLVSVLVNLDNPQELIVNGEVVHRADLTALNEKLAELNPDGAMRVEVETLAK